LPKKAIPNHVAANYSSSTTKLSSRNSAEHLSNLSSTDHGLINLAAEHHSNITANMSGMNHDSINPSTAANINKKGKNHSSLRKVLLLRSQGYLWHRRKECCLFQLCNPCNRACTLIRHISCITRYRESSSYIYVLYHCCKLSSNQHKVLSYFKFFSISPLYKSFISTILPWKLLGYGMEPLPSSMNF
jgi:hypothetical protein